MEYRVLRPDGQVRWVCDRGFPIRDSGGRVVRVAGTAADITKTKLVEDELVAMLAREQAARAEAEAMRDANLALTRNLDPEATLETILDCLGRLVPYDSACVMLREEDSHFAVRALRDADRPAHAEIAMGFAFDRTKNGLLNRVCRTRQSVLVPDTLAEPDWERAPGAEGVRCWFGVPIVAAGEVIGLYSVDKVEPRFFTEEGSVSDLVEKEEGRHHPVGQTNRTRRSGRRRMTHGEGYQG